MTLTGCPFYWGFEKEYQSLDKKIDIIIPLFLMMGRN